MLLLPPSLLRPKQRLPLLQDPPLLVRPVLAPPHDCGGELRPQQPTRGSCEHAHVPLPLEVCVEPRLPALGQAGLQHAPRRHLLQVRDPLFFLRLELLRQGLRVLLLFAQNLDAKLLRESPLLRSVSASGRRHLGAQSVNLRLLLQRAPLRLRAQQPLPLLQGPPLLLRPVLAPVHHCRSELRPQQPTRRRRQHPLLPLLLQPAVQPRLPALAQARLHHPPRRRLLQVRDPLLLLGLELLRQGSRVLLLLTQALDAVPLRQRPLLRLVRLGRRR